MRKFMTLAVLANASIVMAWGPNGPKDDTIVEPQTPPNHEVTPSARGCLDLNGGKVSLDFLYWKASETDLYEATKLPTALTKTTLIEKWVRLHPDWDPGFRIGLGGNLPYDQWDIMAYYTYYYNHTENHRSTYADDQLAGFVPTLLAVRGFGIPKLEGRYRLHYNMLELEIGRDMFLSQRLSFRPLLGAAATWINRKFSVRYAQTVDLNGNVVTPGKGATKIEYFGIGPKVGFNTNWWMSRQWKLFGNLQAAFLYGHLRNHLTSDQTINGEKQRTGDVHNSNDNMVPWLQAQAGIAWGKCLNQGKTYLSLSGAWEINYLWNMFINDTFSNTTTFNAESNLSLQGFTARLQIDF
jgi:hypothetical protein